ncbi:MAG: SCP2 sterol-binding domain-containing protein [Acidiferrobacterales bacterium]
MRLIITGTLLGLFVNFSAFAAPVFMSGEWAAQACNAWNADQVLTNKLKESGWVENDGEKGYKAMQTYRRNCKGSPRAELQIADKDGKATCIYGGWAKTEKLNSSYDYVMSAKDKNWVKMGNGDLGPTGAMMSFRLIFSGPYGEAMSNMGPFKNFLLLTGKVETDRSSCPKK